MQDQAKPLELLSPSLSGYDPPQPLSSLQVQLPTLRPSSCTRRGQGHCWAAAPESSLHLWGRTQPSGSLILLAAKSITEWKQPWSPKEQLRGSHEGQVGLPTGAGFTAAVSFEMFFQACPSPLLPSLQLESRWWPSPSSASIPFHALYRGNECSLCFYICHFPVYV